MERVNPPGLARPSGFSHAVVGDRRLVFLAGQTALDAAGRIVGDGVVEQFERALANLLSALCRRGGEPAHLASLTIYIVDMDDYRARAREIGAVWRRLVGRTTRRWRALASHGSGTPRRSWRYRESAVVPTG